MMTQHDKIKKMCKDGEWHCGNEFRANYIFSPHKRRSEITEEGQYYFEDRKCEHGHKNVRDYRMILNGSKWKVERYRVVGTDKVIEKLVEV